VNTLDAAVSNLATAMRQALLHLADDGATENLDALIEGVMEASSDVRETALDDSAPETYVGWSSSAMTVPDTLEALMPSNPDTSHPPTTDPDQPATAKGIVAELADLGVFAQITLRGELINIFTESTSVKVADTVHPPIEEQGWVWGPSFEHSASASDNAITVARKIKATL
jgi:hypothetical protein